MRKQAFLLLLLLSTAILWGQNPPQNLTAEAGAEYVFLRWEAPEVEGMDEIFYHNGTVTGAFFQWYNQGYGVVYDLSDYPSATLEAIDFRHASYGITGPHQYNLHVINWSTHETIAVLGEFSTTVNDAWETNVPLGSIAAVPMVGIFLEPLSGNPQDAYPVLNYDNNLDAMSYLIDLDDNSLINPSDEYGDFLMDLWISPGRDGGRIRIPSAMASRQEFFTPPVEFGTRVHPEPLPDDRDRLILGYNVYRDGAAINDELVTEISFWDSDVEIGFEYTYYVTAVYDDLGESEPSNSVTVTPGYPDGAIMYQGFETPSIPTGWRIVDADGDGEYWEMAPEEIQSFEGLGCIWSASYDPNSGVPLTPDNWLMSPEIPITETAWLVYWVRTQDDNYPSEHYQVLASTDTTTVEDFTDILFEETLTPGYWHRVILPLSEYIGENIHIAFRHFDSTDQYYVKLDMVYVTTEPVSAEDPETAPPVVTRLQNYPNPFNPVTSIRFELPENGPVRLEVYNILGQRVRTVLDQNLSAGIHEVAWNGIDSDGNPLSSGVYFARLQTDSKTHIHRMVLLK